MISLDNLNIFYLNISECLSCVDIDTLVNFQDIERFVSEKRRIEHCLGRFLLKSSAKLFGIDNPQIEIVNNKPCFKNCSLHFSISHSKDIVLVAFYQSNIGIDIEAFSDRDFVKLAKRYSLKDEQPETFYSFWTEYEATIKLQDEKKSCISFPIFDDKYFLSVCSNQDINKTNVVFHKMRFPKDVSEKLSLQCLSQNSELLF